MILPSKSWMQIFQRASVTLHRDERTSANRFRRTVRDHLSIEQALGRAVIECVNSLNPPPKHMTMILDEAYTIDSHDDIERSSLGHEKQND